MTRLDGARGVLRAAAVLCGILGLGLGAAAQAADPPADEATAIFDGKTLEGWDGNPELWSVARRRDRRPAPPPEKPTKGNTFLVWRASEVGDFES